MSHQENLYWPFDTEIVSEWCGSDRGGGVIHMGTDFAVPQGTELRATAAGRINRYNNDPDGYGLDIKTDSGLIIRNWHLSEMFVNSGDTVEAGQVIALTGGTPGTAGAGLSTGPHLHWELRTNRYFTLNGWLDPRTLSPQNFWTLQIQPPRRETMATMYYVKRDGKITFALAGDGRGKAAWLETEVQDFANKLATIHGSAVQLSPDTWNLWRSYYLGGN